MKNLVSVCVLGLAVLAICGVAVADQVNPYLGRWALTIPGGRPGWLGVVQNRGTLEATILWGGGDPKPAAAAVINEKGELVITRAFKQKGVSPPAKPKVRYDYIHATVDGDDMNLVQVVPQKDGREQRYEFTGKRIASLPPAPDLSKVKYGKPIRLLKKNSLDGWKLVDEKKANGWSVKDGVLSNNPVQKDPHHHISYGNLRTVKEFEDFNLKAEVRIQQKQNSGIYLRGIYEVQVFDSYGQPVSPLNMGAIYGRITPTVSAEKKPGEWQTLDMTLVDRHVIVILNGVKIIDNQPLLGCTGGALWSDETRPGPIYLQGDHGFVQFRNLVLKPVVK